MMTKIWRYGFAFLASFGLTMPTIVEAAAAEARSPAQLIVEDNAQFFTPAKIEEAKSIVSQSMGTGNRQAHIETFATLSKEEQEKFDKATNKKEFWREWAKTKVKGDRGVAIVLCKSPRGLEILADNQMREKGFTGSNEKALFDAMVKHLSASTKLEKGSKEAQSEIDAGLIAAADYLKENLPTTTSNPGQHGKNAAHNASEPSKGSNIMSYVCIGLAVLLGVWLIVGLIRAFTGGGGGGGPGGMGGGGGGGFGTSLLGGLFGAMAGMWMYNQFFGGGMSSAFGGDNGSGSGDVGGGEAGGAGDYSNDQGTGGDWGGGDAGGGDTGGGDWGGGGGDFGGGGDY